MNKQEFLAQLRKKMSGLPQRDAEERLTFYGEMIDDRMEEGLSEEAAVSDIGSVDEVVSQIVNDIPLTKLVKEKMTPKKRLKTWEIVLLILGSPIWLSLLIAAIAVVLSLYAAFWSVIVSLWAVFGSLCGGSFGVIAAGIFFTCSSNVLSGIATLSAGCVAAGVSIFMFFGCKAVTKGTLILTKKIAIWIKNCFIRREEA